MSDRDSSLFSHSIQLPAALEANIRDSNPWWRGERISALPDYKRWAYTSVLRSLKQGLTPVTVLRGPRQVGKTTLLSQMIQAVLQEGVAAKRVLRVQFDELPSLKSLEEPILELSRWFADHILRQTLNAATSDGTPVYLFLDEVQNLADWAPQLKHLVDMNRGLRVLVTGSSALRIEQGRDSLAGRITTFEMGPLLLREIAEIRSSTSLPPYFSNGLASFKEKSFWADLRSYGLAQMTIRDPAFEAFSERGSYPVAQIRADEPWEKLADFLNETVIKRAIQHDLRMGSRGQKRDEHLLEEVFRLTCRYAGQAPKPATYLAEIQQSMGANIGQQRVMAYFRFLDGTLLMRLIEPLELRLKKKKGYPKLCLCDHALRAAWLQEIIPLTPMGLASSPHLADLAGRIAESAAGYFFRSIIALDVAHFPERNAEPEVDFILTIGEQRIPVEVKYRRHIEHSDTVGLRSFLEKTHYNAKFGLLVTLTDEYVSDDPRIVTMPLSTLLMMR
ncbi:MAG: ATP-binding protein [Acidobacteriaceae bacterium]